MLELKKDPNLTPSSLIYEELAKKDAASPPEKQETQKESAKIGGGLGGLAGLMDDDDSDMENMRDLEEEAEI